MPPDGGADEEDGMVDSSEARAAVERFYDRLSAGDVDGTAATIADDPDAFVIGTQRIGGGREEWLGSVRENAAMGVVFESGNVRAWAEGGMGWAVDEPTIVLPNGVRLPTRMTAVLRREPDGSYRILHQHYSWAVPDSVAMDAVQIWHEQLGLAPS